MQKYFNYGSYINGEMALGMDNSHSQGWIMLCGVAQGGATSSNYIPILINGENVIICVWREKEINKSETLLEKTFK